MWDFYESYPVTFHFFPATSFLEQNPRKPKKTICAVSKNFAKLNYIIHPADLMSSWMQFANLHFGHKEIMYLLYIKINTCYNTIFCNCSRMSLYIGIVYILKHEMAIYHVCFRIFDREQHSDMESSSWIIRNVEFLSNYIKILNFSLNMINQLSKHPGKPIYLLWHIILGFNVHSPLFFKINILYKDVMEKEMATHSSILAWKIPWTEEPGGLQSMGSQELDTAERLRTAHST